MKRHLFSVFIVASVMVAIAHCFPGPRVNDMSDEDSSDSYGTRIILPGHGHLSFFQPFFGIDNEEDDDGDDNDGDDFSLKWDNPMSRIYESMRRVMEKLHKQMADVLPGLPENGNFDIRNKIPDGANTTSNTKIIGNHVVTTNETTYRSGDNNSHVVFRVQTIDVKPLNETAVGDENDAEIDLGGGEEIETATARVTDQPDKTTTTEEPRSIETVEDSAGNEIPSRDKVDTLTA